MAKKRTDLKEEETEMSKTTQKRPLWPGGAALTGLGLLALFFLLPLLALPAEEGPRDTPIPTATLPALTPSPSPTPGPEPVAGWDEGQTLRVLFGDGRVETMTVKDYLWGVVAAEMPASFQTEALKAQAVCARTYCLRQRQEGTDKHPGADVCTDYTCCQAFLTREQAGANWGSETRRYTDKIAGAVAATDGLLCLYEGEPIDAVFFSSSAGRTSDAAAVWGAAVPYLTSVESPEGAEVPGWQTIATFTPGEFTGRFLAAHPEADFSGETDTWIRDLTADDTGLVTAVTIGGVTVTGGQARSALGLRSAHFTAETGEDQIAFTVTGYGHGVGMSQYGANALAGEGRGFVEILKWYYTGVTVGPLEG